MRAPSVAELPGRTPAAAGRRRAVWLLAALPWLGGCAVGPDYQVPVLDVPARWSNAPAAQPARPPDLKQWWHRFGDPTLSTLIEEAVAGNLDVATAKAKIREARASRRQAAAGLFPTIDGSGSVTRSRTGATSPEVEPGAPTTLYKAGFDASWEIDLFGANRRTLEAADRGVEAAEDELAATLLTLVGDVASNYAEARGYQARVALARRTAASQRETAAITQRKLDAGSASAVDAAKATAQAAATEAEIPSLQTSYAAAVHRLGVLLGRGPAAVAARLARAAPIPAPTKPLAAGLPADTLRRRPDVRKAERLLAQATARIGAAEAARYPAISLTGSISTAALKAGDLGKASTISWSYGPSVTVPIFDAGKLRAAVAVTEAQRDQSDVAFRAAVLTALEDVENALVALTQERRRTQRLTEAVRAYREAARLARTLYQSGSSSFLDVLDAERSLYSAEDSLLQSRVAVATDTVALAKALGGGWDRPVDSSTPEVVDAAAGPRLAVPAAPRSAAND